MNDCIIIGGGPAGMTAGIYAKRAGYQTLIIEKISTGGQMIMTDTIENFPGFDEGVSGFELQQNMERQALKFGVKIISDDVRSLSFQDNVWNVETSEKTYQSKTVIICTGATHKQANIKGETHFIGNGVSYCATCDGPFFKNYDVAVIGGGDSALTEALFLSKICKTVTIIHRRDKFRAVKSLINKVTSTPNITIKYNCVAEEILGERSVKGLSITNKTTNANELVYVDGVFVFIGLVPNSSFLNQELLDKDGYVITNRDMSTKFPGLFAAGDIRSGAFRQIICACSDGAVAAKSASDYIENANI